MWNWGKVGEENPPNVYISNKNSVKDYRKPNFINSSLLRYTYNRWNKIKDFDNDSFLSWKV